MRCTPILLGCLALVACASTDATDGTDSDTDASTEDGPHPLVPEEFSLLWNTDGECSNEFGDGNQVYMIGEGRLETDGSLSVDERVFWFYADEPRSADCVDRFTVTASEELVGDPADLGYSGGEHFYDVRRELTEEGCDDADYRRLYRSDDDGLYQRLIFDTLNEFNDTPNENDKIAVWHEERNFFGEGYVTKEYAQEPGSVIEPDTDVHGPPATIRWIGKRCVIPFRGGGGGGGG